MLLCLAHLPDSGWAQEILIQSGEHEDTILRVGPPPGADNDGLRIETDPDNGTTIMVTSPPARTSQEYPDPIFITPEIIIRK